MFNLFRKKKKVEAEPAKEKIVLVTPVVKAEEKKEARQRFKGLPVELSRPKQDRLAQRLMRLYQCKSPDKEVLGSIKKIKEQLKLFGVFEPPVNLTEAEALVHKIKKDRQEK